VRPFCETKSVANCSFKLYMCLNDNFFQAFVKSKTSVVWQSLTKADKILMWLTFVHLYEFRQLPGCLYDPSDSNPGVIVKKVTNIAFCVLFRIHNQPSCNQRLCWRRPPLKTACLLDEVSPWSCSACLSDEVCPWSWSTCLLDEVFSWSLSLT